MAMTRPAGMSLSPTRFFFSSGEWGERVGGWVRKWVDKVGGGGVLIGCVDMMC